MASVVQENDNDSSSTAQVSIAVSLTGVTIGNTIAVFSKAEGASVSTHVVTDGIGNTLQALTRVANPAPDSWGQWHYYTCPSSGNYTYTCTFTPATDFPSIFVYELTPSVGNTLAFDVEKQGNGNSSSMTSGNFTTAGAGIALCGYAEIISVAVSSAQINGVAADRFDGVPSNITKVWTLAYGSGFTGAATATLSTASNYALTVLAFKEVPLVYPGPLAEYSNFPKHVLATPFPGVGGAGPA